MASVSTLVVAFGKKLLMKEHAEAMKHIGVMILKVGGRDPSLLGG